MHTKIKNAEIGLVAKKQDNIHIYTIRIYTIHKYAIHICTLLIHLYIYIHTYIGMCVYMYIYIYIRATPGFGPGLAA